MTPDANVIIRACYGKDILGPIAKWPASLQHAARLIDDKALAICLSASLDEGDAILTKGYLKTIEIISPELTPEKVKQIIKEQEYRKRYANTPEDTVRQTTSMRAIDECRESEMPAGQSSLFDFLEDAAGEFAEINKKLEDSVEKFRVRFNKRFAEYDARADHIVLPLRMVLPLKQTISLKLLTYICWHLDWLQDEGYIEIPVELIKAILDCHSKTYREFKHLRSQKLNPAVQEINNSLLFHIEVNPIRTGRVVTSVRFVIKNTVASALRDAVREAYPETPETDPETEDFPFWDPFSEDTYTTAEPKQDLQKMNRLIAYQYAVTDAAENASDAIKLSEALESIGNAIQGLEKGLASLKKVQEVLLDKQEILEALSGSKRSKDEILEFLCEEQSKDLDRGTEDRRLDE